MSYAAFVDPSGGSADSMTLAVGHRQDEVAIIDATRERKPPFSPEDVVAEFAALLKSYRISKVTGDRYGGEWPRERFREHGITYEPAAKPKSDLYRDMLPAINSRQLELLDDARLVAQIVGLERRTARGGRDSIDHAPGGHDDLCNAVAGVVAELASANSFAGWGIFEYTRREAEKVSGGLASAPGKPPPPDFGWAFSSSTAKQEPGTCIAARAPRRRHGARHVRADVPAARSHRAGAAGRRRWASDAAGVRASVRSPTNLIDVLRAIECNLLELFSDSGTPLLASRPKPRGLHLLGEYGGGDEAPDQLLACLVH